jgi:hypothetical protein
MIATKHNRCPKCILSISVPRKIGLTELSRRILPYAAPL